MHSAHPSPYRLPAYGARPLKRVLQRRVQDPLAIKILRGEIGEGERLVVIDARNGEMTFTVAL